MPSARYKLRVAGVTRSGANESRPSQNTSSTWPASSGLTLHQGNQKCARLPICVCLASLLGLFSPPGRHLSTLQERVMERPMLLVTIDWQLVLELLVCFPHFHVIFDLSYFSLLAGFFLGYPACWSSCPRPCMLASASHGRGAKTFVPSLCCVG